MNMQESKLQRCLQLAKLGLGTTYPNPMVGCVITHKDKIIGEGWHQKAGENHAEINAIKSVQNKDLLSESTLYVNLEPCSHFGKTPPCTHAIVRYKIPKIVIGTQDFASHVNGSGIEYLEKHGVEIIKNVLAKECIHLNRRFFTNQLKQRPYIILKWAETANGYFAPEEENQKWITSLDAKQLVHFWRSKENGILVGRKTLEIDQPQLNVRLWNGNHPKKYFLSLKKNNEIFKGFKNLLLENAEFNTSNILKALKNLLKDDVNSIIIEGGAKTLHSFIDIGLWDEARVISSSVNWKNGKPSPTITNALEVEKTLLTNQELLTTYYNYELPMPKH